MASALRAASLEQMSDESFAEYYHPVTGVPLGSLQQSWTAAAALDWLLDEDQAPIGTSRMGAAGLVGAQGLVGAAG